MKRYFLLLLSMGAFFHCGITHSMYMNELDWNREQLRMIEIKQTERKMLQKCKDIQKKYAKPDETLVSMGEIKSITVSSTDPEKTISTHGLAGCTTIVIYAIQKNIQKAYMSHHSTCQLSQESSHKIIASLQKENFQPDSIKIVIASLADPVKNEITGRWEPVLREEIKKMEDNILYFFKESFPQANIHVIHSLYRESISNRYLDSGDRDITVFLNPDYEKSYFYNFIEGQRINFNEVSLFDK